MNKIKRLFVIELPKNISSTKDKILSFKGGLTIFSLAIVALLPTLFNFFTDTPKGLATYLDFFLYAMIIGIFGASWDLLAGITGLFSLGHSVFFGLAAYFLAIGTVYWGVSSFVMTILSASIVVLIGAAIGWMCLRLKGPYLALTLLAMSILLFHLFNEPSLTKWFYGESGITDVPRLFERDILIGVLFNFYSYFLIMIVSVSIMKIIAQSKFGTVLKAIRDDDTGAQASGINLSKYKVIVFAISCFFAGIAGALYAMNWTSAVPAYFQPSYSFLPIMMAAVGGLSTITGAVLGSFLYGIIRIIVIELKDVPAIKELPIVVDFLEIGPVLIFAIFLIIVIRFAPNGILNPAIEKLRLTWELVKGN
ncbi:MAG: branched-chain amino acid ABC transporter permease [Promethearchaeota archaeon]